VTDGPRWQAGSVLSKNELLEFSSATIPANPGASQRYVAGLVADRARADGGLDIDSVVRTVLDETLDARVRDLLLDVARTDPEFRRVVAAFALTDPSLRSLPATERNLAGFPPGFFQE
jgi:hypothetical protein